MTATEAYKPRDGVEPVAKGGMGSGRANAPPGPEPTWNPMSMARTLRAYFADPLGFVAEQFATYGDIFQLRLGPKRYYFTRSPQHFHEILVRQPDAFVKGNRTGYVFRSGILVADGEAWRVPARAIQPHFSKAAVAANFGVMRAAFGRLIDRWSAGQTRDLNHEVSKATLAVVCEGLLGQHLDDRAAGVLLESLGRIERSVEHFDPLPRWIPTMDHLGLWRARRTIDGLLAPLVSIKTGNSIPSSLVALTGGTLRRADVRQIRDQIVTMYFAGYRTTAHALVWTLLLIAQHPEVEGRLIDELERVLRGREPELADLGSLEYLAKIVTESLRLRPPSYLLERIAVRDVEIDGYRIEKGHEVFLHIYAMHHDSRWYAEPDQFLPERAFYNPLAYCPFGIGKRVCVGKSFALQELALALAMFVQRFKVRLREGHLLEHKPLITLGPKAPLPACLYLRSQREVGIN